MKLEQQSKQLYQNAVEILNRLSIVKQWMEGKGRPVSWDVLIHVLNDNGLKNLARDIEEEIYH